MLPNSVLPDRITGLTEAEAHGIISRAKQRLGQQVVILGHHYQRDDVIKHADFMGDSLKLARIAQEHKSARYIIFCGVHFMAESADILTDGKCEVCLPDLGAGCEMADMADVRDVELAWDDALSNGATEIVPVTYINSSAALKAFVGKNGGLICTSSNAKAAVLWALEHGKHVFFFPDQHLGRNICKALGFSTSTEMLLWDPKKYLGGHSPSQLSETKIWLWEGHCPVHALFTVHQIKKIRESSPQTRIIVHPECAMDIVDHSDLSGSTDFIIKTVSASPAGSSWAIGTEKNLVERLAKTYPDKTISSLNPFSCLCGTMNRISLQSLAWVMDQIASDQSMPNRIQVSPAIASDARLALDRMMQL
ncbi:MAG: quinolinate synthase NadA [Proteobacteria bacterium]|nr:quinolinate synthase NadA [Pseudomonadota bacterium]